ncbi:MAG: F0F1 ATP synthase subunit epsilon [Candidatus Liberibacter europaeus]|uniref:ATP synthase epsilon chain n=1 Tax=Candidatus Liberibacter europaeus TaxID=744859 RepID=A0A2T4VYN0_9HYPH|nr:F0F1 ATP synthase subunit epsilon [Candidatus Liberibacter europaeus]PTL86875.1 MAG: F0F1 ATP synthase subunit epsilon [Candidatus Liberibacter europaeus]
MSIVSSFYFELVSPERCIFSGDIKSILLPLEDGYTTILAGHSAILSTITPGIITIEPVCGDILRYIVFKGIVTVSSLNCIILTDNVFLMDEFCVGALNSRISETNDIIENICDFERKYHLEQFVLDLSCLRNSLHLS